MEGDVLFLNIESEPPKKKLKQTQLPFQILGPKIKIGERKRKLSDTSLDDGKVVKQVKPDDKENDVDLNDKENVEFDTDINSQEISNERDKNQPDISSFFTTLDKSEKCLVKQCFVDLSTSKICDDNICLEGNSDDEISIIEVEDDDPISSSEHDTSIHDSGNTPSHTSQLCDVSETGTSPKLTPKQLQRKLESLKRQEERERLRQEKLKKQQEEKQKLKQEREELKKKEREQKEEQKRKEREEKDEQRKKEREEKERKRLLEVEQKNEEKRKKEEQKDAERRKKEQEKLDLELKQKKAAAAFAKFFVTNKSESTKSEDLINDTPITNFMPFAIKNDMRIAPVSRYRFSNNQKEEFEKIINSEVNKENLYLSELKSGKSIGKATKTWILPVTNVEDDDVIIIDEESSACTGDVVELVPEPQKMRIKLLQFHENRRPPYWGTWRKRSSLIKPRCPLATDSKIFDYDVDSDDEWEEEEPGESLHGSDDEKDSDCDEKENEYDIDNVFMVPHGYLSEEEALGEDEDMVENPDMHKAKLKALEIEFQCERNEKTERLRPRLYGCIWLNKENKHSSTPQFLQNFFYDRQMLFNEPIVLLSRDVDEFTLSPSASKFNISPQKKRQSIPEKYYPDLIRLVHGNINGKSFLCKEFKTFINTIEEDLFISKKHFESLLRETAVWMQCPDDGPMKHKFCWYVNKEFREKYYPEAVIPNCWKYILKPKRINIESSAINDKISAENDEKKSLSSDITKFTKVISEEEKQKQFNMETTSTDLSTNVPIKKRIQLTTISSHCTIPKKAQLTEVNCLPLVNLNKATESVNKPEVNNEPKPKKKINLITLSEPRTNNTLNQPPTRTNLLTQFIKKLELTETTNVKAHLLANKDQRDDNDIKELQLNN